MADVPNGITIDGRLYNLHVKSCKRSFQVLDGSNAERAQAGNMIRDIIGTYYNYTMVVEADENQKEEYDEFYQVISAPVASHVIVVPYAQGTLVFDAYVTAGDDNVDIITDTSTRWSGLSLQFIAMEPQRFV